MTTSVTLVPTNGRSYRTESIAIEDLFNGEQFKLPNGKCCTIKSMPLLLSKFDKVTLFYDVIDGGWLDITNLEEIRPH